MKWLNPRRFSHHRIRLSGLGLAAMLLPIPAAASDSDSAPAVILESPDLPGRSGSIVGSAKTGFRFVATGTSEAIPLSAGHTLIFPPVEVSASPPRPPFQLLAGECTRISGTFKGLDSTAIGFSLPWDERGIRMPRAAVQAIVQFPGESRIFADGFEAIESRRWSIHGEPAVVDNEHLGGRKSLRINRGENAITHRLEDPLISGRVDLAFHDSGKVIAGNRCGVELTFRGPSGPKAMRIELGWREESLTVESPGGPALAVQRLARLPGWHRLSARFNSDATEISVDGKLLANGKGPAGPLTALRMGSSAAIQDGDRSTADDSPYYFDEMRLVRFSEPPNSVEVDISQDEARLTVGDQLFGSLLRADPERIAMTVDTRTVDLPWSEVSGLHLRRQAAIGSPVEGTLVRVEWAPGAGKPPDLDFAEGALAEVTATSVILATPYAGALRLPRDRIRSIAVRGNGRRLVIDGASHHLGDEISVEPPLLDPPLPEGITLERTVDLQAPVDRPAFLSLDVLLVVGEEIGLPFSEFIRKGELRTYVTIGGKRIDYLNRHIKTRNETVERIRIAIPEGSLQAGQNVIRIEQTASSDDPTGFDDLGILQMALEFDSDSRDAQATANDPNSRTPTRATAPEKP